MEYQKMNNSMDNTNFLGVYYDNNLNPYILAGNFGKLKYLIFQKKNY